MIPCLDSFQQSKLFSHARNLIFEIACGDIQRIFADAEIPFLVLKGPHVAATLYDDPLQRVYCDLDILVKPEHFYPAAKILLANDFKLFSINRRRLASEEADYQLLMRSPRGVAVELHRALADRDQFHSDVAGLFQRAEEFTFGALKFRGLGTEDLLLHLCLHFGKRHFMTSEKKHLLDIALLLKKIKMDWPIFLERVKKAGCRIITFYCLQAVQRQHGAEVPQKVMDSLSPSPWHRRILDGYLDPSGFPIYRFHTLVPGTRERMANLLLLDRIPRMISSLLGFSVRSMLNILLRAAPLRRMWIKRYPLAEWIE